MNNFKRPMLCASLLRPNQEHTNEVILAAMERLYKLIPGPRIVTLKEDGIRGVRLNDLYSRTIKLIPNRSIRARSIVLPAGMDVELCSHTLQYYQTESIVMSREHADSDLIQFYAIDWFKDKPYIDRLIDIGRLEIPGLYKPLWHWAKDANELMLLFLEAEQNNGEGICWRLPNSPYIQKNTIDNRSTLIEQYLIKLARYVRQEVIVLGLYEQMENGNESSYNALGAMDRSSCKANKLGKNTLGGFHVKSLSTGLEFDVGTGVGLTDRLRKEIWLNQDKFIGTTRVVKHKACGQKVLPRSPIDCGPRKKIDII